METNTDVNILKSDKIVIENNVIEMDDSIIQISNVASVSLRFPPKYTYSNKIIITGLIGLAMIFSKINILTLLGLVVAGVVGYLVYRVWDKNNNLGKNIIISTGSGGYFWINSRDDSFSLKVIEVIKNLMNGQNDNSNILINLEKLNILNNGNIVYGNVQNSTLNKDSGNYANNTDSIIGDHNQTHTGYQIHNTGQMGNVNQGENNQNNDIPELRI